MGSRGFGPGSGPPPFLQEVFPPELIMRNQEAIGVSDVQRESILDLIRASQKKLVDVEWQLGAEAETLTKLLKAETVDEGAALARLDHLMQIEKEMKREHFALLIRLKNQLTPAQQAKLRELRPAYHGPPGFHGPPPGMGP